MLKLRYYFGIRKKTSNFPWLKKHREWFAAERSVQSQEMEHFPMPWITAGFLCRTTDLIRWWIEYEKYYQHNNSDDFFKCYTYNMNTPYLRTINIVVYIKSSLFCIVEYYSIVEYIAFCLSMKHFMNIWLFQLRAIKNKSGWTLMYKILYGVVSTVTLFPKYPPVRWMDHMWNDIPNSSSSLHFH